LARETFALCRSEGYDDKEIADWVKVYGEAGNWSRRQIYSALHDNGVQPYDRYQDGDSAETALYHPIDLTQLKSLVFRLSGVKHTMILQMDYSPEKVGRMAQKSLLQATATT
jgi:hypothetical protein